MRTIVIAPPSQQRSARSERLRWVIATALAGAAFVVSIVGCGISQSSLDAAVDQLRVAQADLANSLPQVDAAFVGPKRHESGAYSIQGKAPRDGYSWVPVLLMVSNGTQGTATLNSITVVGNGGRAAGYFYAADAFGGATTGVNDPVTVGPGATRYVVARFFCDGRPGSIGLDDETLSLSITFSTGQINLTVGRAEESPATQPAELATLFDTPGSNQEVARQLCRVYVERVEADAPDPLDQAEREALCARTGAAAGLDYAEAQTSVIEP